MPFSAGYSPWNKGRELRGEPKPCRDCGAETGQTPSQIKRLGYICSACWRQREFERRAQRKAEGRPVRPGRPSREYYRAWTSKPENKLKNATRAPTRYAIKHGKLVQQPCEQCGALPTEAHHDD